MASEREEILIRIKQIDEGILVFMNNLNAALSQLRVQSKLDTEASEKHVQSLRREINALKEKIDEQRAAKRVAEQELSILRESERLEKSKANARSTASRAQQAAAAAARRDAADQAREQRLAIRRAEQQLQDRLRVAQAELRQARETSRAQQQAARDALRVEQARSRAQQQAAKEASRIQSQMNRDALNAAKQRSAEEARILRQQQAAMRVASREQARAQQQWRGYFASTASAAGGLFRQVLLLAGAFSGLAAIRGFINAGLEFNAVIESSTLGIASLITAESRLEDSHGKLLTGTNALQAGIFLAEQQVQKLRVAGIQTAATTEQLVDAFQQAVGAGIKVGLSLDQIRVFTVRAVQAAFALGIPMNQLNQEVRSILDATIDRNSRVAKALQLTNAEIKAAREQNRLAQFLEERFKSFEAAGERAMTTFRVLKSNVIEAFQVFAGDATQPLFDAIRIGGLRALKTVFDFDSAQISTTFRGLLDGFRSLFEAIGHALVDGIDFAIKSAQSLADWFARNKDEVQDITGAVGEMVRSFGLLLASIIGVPIELAKSATETNALAEGFRLAASFIDVIRDNIFIIEAALVGIAIKGGITALLFGGPITLAITALTAVLTLVKYLDQRQQQIALAQARRAGMVGDEISRVRKLAQEYVQLAEVVTSNRLAGDQLRAAQARLRDVTADLIRAAPQYASILRDQQQTLKETADQLDRITKQRQIDFAIATIAAEQNVSSLANEKMILQRQLDFQTEQAQLLAGNDEAYQGQVVLLKATEKEIDRVNSQLEVARVRADSMKDALGRMADAMRGVTVPSLVEPARTPTTPRAINDAEQAQKGILALTKARIEKEKKLADDQFKSNKIAARDYFQLLQRLNEEVIDQEIRVRRARIAASTDEGEKQQALGEIEAFEEQRKKLAEDTSQKITEFEKQQAEQRAQLDIQLLELQGEKAVAAAKRLAAQYKDALEAAFREKDFKTVLDINKIITFETAKAQAEDLFSLVEQSIQKMEATQATVNTLVTARTLSQADANKLLNNSYKETIKVIEKVLPVLEALLPILSTADPALANQIALLRQRLLELRAATKATSNDWQDFNRQARGAIEDGLTQGIKDSILHVNSLGEAWRNAAQAIMEQIAQIIARMIALKIVEATLGSFGGGLFSEGGKVEKKAAGGLIRGPGTATSDSVLARLSDGEFVIRAAAVEKYGVGLFEELNRAGRSTPVRRSSARFASGGPVRVAGAGTGGGNSLLSVGLAAGLVVDRFEQDPRSPKVVLTMLANNKQAVRRILGR